MSSTLLGFAYGEHVEGPYSRSLGYRLLAPADKQPWCDEVEALARRLQAAPYPDHWPPVDLFCSALLGDGRRLIAAARYGLADRTPSQRRGGLELVGVIAPGSLGVSSALAVYQWLRQRRAQAEDLRCLGGQVELSAVLADVPPVQPPRDPVPVLPIRMWQEGALLFAATAPSDPDQRLGLLEAGAEGQWQWLPLVGTDFPMQTYAQRGPLVAWTPHLAGVAVKLDRAAEGPAAVPGLVRWSAIAVGLLVLVLLVANLWATLALSAQWKSAAEATAVEPVRPLPAASGDAGQQARERFARALYDLLQRQGGIGDWNQAQLLQQYERLAVDDSALRVSSNEGKQAVAAAALLTRRSPRQVELLVREALANKGYDARLIDLACQRVHQHLSSDLTAGP